MILFAAGFVNFGEKVCFNFSGMGFDFLLYIHRNFGPDKFQYLGIVGSGNNAGDEIGVM